MDPHSYTWLCNVSYHVVMCNVSGGMILLFVRCMSLVLMRSAIKDPISRINLEDFSVEYELPTSSVRDLCMAEVAELWYSHSEV